MVGPARPATAMRIAVVCSSNQNRSCEAHALLQKSGYSVESFGVGATVKIPGTSREESNEYPFSVTYNEIYEDLCKKDREFYEKKGLLGMVDRNRQLKPKPERFQDSKEFFDLIFTVEERIFDRIVEDSMNRSHDAGDDKIQQVININVEDSLNSAAMGAKLILEIVQRIDSDFEENGMDNLEEILLSVQEKSGRTILHTQLLN
ncbi:MAG: RNA polymerase II subunit A C-terminal domain phosphatase [Marteilia pararefringens]